MLYVTTRENKDAYTPRHPLCKDRGPDGGLFVPFQDIRFTGEEITALAEQSFGQSVAEVLNRFFSGKLTGWEVDFALGRRPIRLVAMSHKILVAEMFNNPGNAFSWTVRKMRDLMVPDGQLPEELSQWTFIAVRVAVLFGVFGELIRLGLVEKPVDVSVSAEDFSAAMSVLYAKEMGLPIGKIVFGCTETSGLWDLFHHGVFRTGREPASLERLIYARLGRGEAVRYGQKVSRKSLYTISDEARRIFSKDFFGAVIGQKRMQNVMRNVQSTNSYCLEPNGALAYGALQDFRAIQNEVSPALILTEYSPENAKE